MPQANGSGRPVFSISAVARLTGVPTATIRTWERRYGLVIPGRSPGGQRLYTQDQADELTYLRAQVDGGLSAADAHRLLAAQPDRAQSHRAQSHRAQSHRAEPGPAHPGLGLPDPGLSDPTRPCRGVVLLAERDRYAAEAAGHFLAAAGFDVRVASTAAAALSLLPADTPGPLASAGSRPVAAVVELLISGGAGLELCRSLHQHGIPVIAVSVLNLRDQALAAGASCFLAKPLDPRRLTEVVAGHARKRAVQPESAGSPAAGPRAAQQ